MSPIIFILTFQPIIDFLMKQEKFGYCILDKSIITLPYADDFCLITTNMKTQQRLINQINLHIQSMGMELKPSKCRSFSIKSGKPTKIKFFIDQYSIPSIADEEQKFLGIVLFFTGKSSETYAYMKSNFEEKLNNIDGALIRNEFKMWIFQNYFLPAIRFLLTIHDITFSDIKKLDSMVNKFLKKWCEIPCSGTNLIFHMKEGMNIPTISQLYDEVHSLNLTEMRMKGDPIVNAALDNALSRESQYTRKKSSVVASQSIYDAAISEYSVRCEMPSLPDEECDSVRYKLTSDVKKSVKSHVRLSHRESDISHLSGLLKQGEYLKFTQEEKNDMGWKGFIYNLKKGTMKFLLNSFIHTLPTQNNLKLWNKTLSDKCHLCSNRDSTLHCLSGCSVSLTQGRYI